MHTLSFEEFEKLSRQGNVVPVYASFLADLLTPVSAFLRLRQASRRAFLLESVEGGEKTARYSFLGCQPFASVRFANGVIQEERDGRTRTFRGDIFAHLDQTLRRYRSVRPPGLPRFTGGAVGYFGYETVRLIERLPEPRPDGTAVPDALFMIFDTILVFDHLTHQIYVIANAFLDEAPAHEAYARARARIEAVQELLARELAPPVRSEFDRSEEPVSNWREADFCRAVARAKDYIYSGDAFQIVLSQRFHKKLAADPFDVYRALRVINPSPYLYFVSHDDLCIVGSSPELLVRVEDGVVEVRPIAGTRPRGRTEAEDTRLAEELRSDEKEVAEHVMLVDLGRNDVGRVSQSGTVEVTEFMTVEKYSHVMHLVSNVRGKLKAEFGALDALRACFPAGTVSGAPKIRAMEIVHELEPCRRGVYAGALGYLDFSGNLDTCIAIRTMVCEGNRAYFQAGAGIVADSVPEREYQETVDKASAIRAAIEFAERGLT